MSNARNNAALFVATSLLALTGTAYAQEAEIGEVDEIVVRGIRGAQQDAIDIKRNADQIVDSISAEDIGRLPDATISDSLQRIPGVQIRRQAGEGGIINIRGVGSVLTNLNNELFLSANSITGVQPDYTDIPASLLTGVDIVKSPTASTLAGGISGTVNLRTRRPFSLGDGFTATGAVETIYGSYGEDFDEAYNGLIGWNNRRVGFVVAGSYSNMNLANYQVGLRDDGWTGLPAENWAWGWAVPSEIPNIDVNGDGDDNDVFVAYQSHSALNRFDERERIGLSGAFQARISDSLQFTAEAFYTDITSYDRAAGLNIDNAWANWGWFYPAGQGEATLVGQDLPFGGQNLYSVQVWNLLTHRAQTFSQVQVTEAQSLNTNFELSYDNGGAFTWTARYINAEAERHRTNNIAEGYITDGSQHGLFADFGNGDESVNPGGVAGFVPITVNYTGEHPTFNFGNLPTASASTYSLVSTYADGFDQDASLEVLRWDGAYDRRFGLFESVQFGLRWAERDATNTAWRMVAPFYNNAVYAYWKDYGLRVPGAGTPYEVPGVSGLSIGQQQPFTGLPSNYVIPLNDFGPVNIPGPGFLTINPRVMDDAFAFQNSLYPGNIAVSQPALDYAVSEETQTAYLQANFSSGADWNFFPFRANIGVQVIQTDLRIQRNIVGYNDPDSPFNGFAGTPEDDLGDEITSRSYTDYLPAVNIAFDLTDDLRLRFAYAKTMTRLDLQNLGESLQLFYSRNGNADPNLDPDAFIVVSASSNGNPLLDPSRSQNFDISLEWYLGPASLISLAVFRMESLSGARRETVQMALPDLDGVVRRTVAVDLLSNGGGGSVTEGVELGYRQAFDFLPGFLGNFGIDANYTYAPSESGQFDLYGEELPAGDNSKHQTNFALWYQGERLQARIAHNYRSERLVRATNIWGQIDVGIWQQPTHYVDASVSYDITPNFTLYLQAQNITEEFEDYYIQWENQVLNQNIYERRITLGARARF